MTAAPGRAAVLGSPISHSKSPQLHGAAYEHLGLDIAYSRIELGETAVEQFLAGEGSKQGWLGWSVTMPLKAVMVPQMTTVSPRVQTLGVLNTVVIAEDPAGGRTLHGENTDVDGIVTALREQGVTRDEPAAGTCAVLGAGGTAAAALAAAAELNVAEVFVYARSLERAAAARPLAARLGLPLTLRPLAALGEDISAGLLKVVISTLPPHAADPLAKQLPDKSAARPVLLDVAYDPWPSAIAHEWARRGWPVTSGLEMLLHQAVRQVELFTERTHNPAAVQNAADRSLMVQRMRAAVGLPAVAGASER
ncbi:shikimate dehydrogenase [Nesterenkonia muleiensis]|uniref:shikimate dehydrogenase n=1 Tax=Nesterenkonia muleiensis TaxID=2282648 RepID=UPI000E70C781|nr:shikimate dehydrogenase [Nesterenkonia muleiensis]